MTAMSLTRWGWIKTEGRQDKRKGRLEAQMVCCTNPKHLDTFFFFSRGDPEVEILTSEATPPKPEESSAESSSDAASEVEVRLVVQRCD